MPAGVNEGWHDFQDASFANAATVAGGGTWTNGVVSGGGFSSGTGPGGSLATALIGSAAPADYALINDGTGFSGSTNDSPFSWAMWIKKQPGGSGATILSNSEVEAVNLSAGVVTLFDTASYYRLIDCSSAGTDWFHLAGTFVANFPTTTSTFYLNGVEVASTGDGDFASQGEPSYFAFNAAQDVNGAGGWRIAGLHADPTVAWDATRIAELYAEGVSSALRYPGVRGYRFAEAADSPGRRWRNLSGSQ